jgi:hypothetical protein
MVAPSNASPSSARLATIAEWIKRRPTAVATGALAVVLGVVRASVETVSIVICLSLGPDKSTWCASEKKQRFR